MNEEAIAAHIIANHRFLGQRAEKGEKPSLSEFRELCSKYPLEYVNRYLETIHPESGEKVITMFE